MSTSTLARIRRFGIAGAAAAAVVLPLVLVSTPAEAATLNGCTVTPLAPIRVGTKAAGVPIVRFSTRVTCVNDRIVQIQDDRREDDPRLASPVTTAFENSSVLSVAV